MIQEINTKKYKGQTVTKVWAEQGQSPMGLFWVINLDYTHALISVKDAKEVVSGYRPRWGYHDISQCK